MNRLCGAGLVPHRWTALGQKLLLWARSSPYWLGFLVCVHIGWCAGVPLQGAVATRAVLYDSCQQQLGQASKVDDSRTQALIA